MEMLFGMGSLTHIVTPLPSNPGTPFLADNLMPGFSHWVIKSLAGC